MTKLILFSINPLILKVFGLMFLARGQVGMVYAIELCEAAGCMLQCTLHAIDTVAQHNKTHRVPPGAH